MNHRDHEQETARTSPATPIAARAETVNNPSRARRWPVLGLFVALAACAAAIPVTRLSLPVAEKTVQFQHTPLDTAWVTPAGMSIVIDRTLGIEREQKIGLVNDTVLQGDNYLWLRARVPEGYPAGNLRLADFMSRVGEVPYPFTRVSDDNLRSRNDSLGQYFYLTEEPMGEVNCVLAFRRIDNASRLLPRGTSTLELLLRNCVRGSVDQALRPITDEQIGTAAVAGISPAQGGNRMLSPLAAPPMSE
ncbi:hypothetical protein ACXN5S_05550 [Pseudoroseicyclus sp. H15]